ncbi:uncharacterized protein LOC131593155 [Vicia villosa]|uniref:uncharacterized protein LOC131593155 n=1 Tax=Vicia villosa TaxID=3911 RepID=UPI00273C9ED0|nr:uncharacterized protein LOC131593155 [Vicia villosa]
MPTLIQTWRWLVRPKVWRFVGFASAVVGLVCYALSSSFNYLFGKWNPLKIVLYSVFGLIISLMIFCAELLPRSTSLRFKAHTAFSALAFTSAYSFFFDKVVKGTPDLYSLFSCAAFAVMSLSLSTQTQFGFEIDLLYFFLGCLIVQLMKIKWQLFVVGAAFSYGLIITRTSFSSIDDGENNQYPDLHDIFVVTPGLQLTSSNIANASNNNGINSPQLVIITDISSMMEQLRKFVTALQHENSNFIQMLLEHVKNYVVADPNYLMDALKPETIKGLEETAKVMVSAGFEKDFFDVYINCRRECLNQCLMHIFFGLHNFSVKDVHSMPWKNLEAEIEKWIKAFNVTLKILLPGERRLCSRILSSTTADLSFVEISRGSTTQLLNFANSIANGSRSPERLFKMSEVFETLRDLIPDFDLLFCEEYSVSLRNEAITIWERLGEAVREIFMELEDLVDSSSTYGQMRRIMDALESSLNEKFKFQ